MHWMVSEDNKMILKIFVTSFSNLSIKFNPYFEAIKFNPHFEAISVINLFITDMASKLLMKKPSRDTDFQKEVNHGAKYNEPN